MKFDDPAEAVEQALYRLGEHYDPTSAERNHADAAHIVAFLAESGWGFVATRPHIERPSRKCDQPMVKCSNGCEAYRATDLAEWTCGRCEPAYGGKS